MYELKDSVGVGRPNKPADVAFLQFAFKVIKAEDGKPIYAGPIDGSFSEEVFTDIAYRYASTYKLPNSLAAVRPFVSASGLLRILRQIPQEYHRYRFHLFLDRGSLEIYLADERASISDNDKKLLPLPKEEADAFRRVIARIRRRFGAFLNVKDYLLDHSGRILISTDVVGGYRLNLATLKISASKEASTQRYRDFLSNSSFARFDKNKVWDLEASSLLLFKSRRVHNDLIMPIHAKKLILRKLGLNFSSANTPAIVNHCMALYEKAVLLDELDDKLEKKIFECFGADAASIKSNMFARRAATLSYLKELADLDVALKKNKDKASRLSAELLALKKEFKVENDSDIDREVLERYLDIAAELSLTSFIKAGGRAVKHLARPKVVSGSLKKPVSGPSNKRGPVGDREELGAGLTAEAATIAKSVAEDNYDRRDAIISAVSILALGVAFVFSGPIGVIAVIVKVIATVASISKSIYEIIQYENLRPVLKTLGTSLKSLAEEEKSILESAKLILEQFQSNGGVSSAADVWVHIKNGDITLDDGDVFISYAARKAYLAGD